MYSRLYSFMYFLCERDGHEHVRNECLSHFLGSVRSHVACFLQKLSRQVTGYISWYTVDRAFVPDSRRLRFLLAAAIGLSENSEQFAPAIVDFIFVDPSEKILRDVSAVLFPVCQCLELAVEELTIALDIPTTPPLLDRPWATWGRRQLVIIWSCRTLEDLAIIELHRIFRWQTSASGDRRPRVYWRTDVQDGADDFGLHQYTTIHKDGATCMSTTVRRVIFSSVTMMLLRTKRATDPQSRENMTPYW
jgi:hypothetical protein